MKMGDTFNFDKLELKIDDTIINGVNMLATDKETVYMPDGEIREMLSFSFSMIVNNNIPAFKKMTELVKDAGDKVFKILFKDDENIFVYDDMKFRADKKFDETEELQIHAFYFERI